MIDKMHYFQIEDLYPKLNEVIEALNAQDALIKEMVQVLGEKGLVEVNITEETVAEEVPDVADPVVEEVPVVEEPSAEIVLDLEDKDGES